MLSLCVTEPLGEAALGASHHPCTSSLACVWAQCTLVARGSPREVCASSSGECHGAVWEPTPLTPGWADSRVVPLPTRLRSALPTLPDALVGAGDPSLRGTSTHFE